MAASSGLRIRAFLVTLIVASGMGFWLVQGGEAAAARAAPAEPADCAALSCDGCGDGQDGEAGCLALCAAAAQVILPAELLTPPPASRAAFQASAVSSDGRTYDPAHGPPKFLTTG